MGLLDSIRKLVQGTDETAFTVPEGTSPLPIEISDERIAKRIAGSATLAISQKPMRMKDTKTGKTISSEELPGFPVSYEGKAFGLVPTDQLAPLLSRFGSVAVSARREEGGLVALLPDAAWFEAAAAGILDLPSDVQVIHAYFSDKEWNGIGPGIQAFDPLDVELIGGAHDAAGGQLMNFYTGTGVLVASLPNKSYSFQKLRRKYPDHILGATAEELAEDYRGSRHRINVFVS